MNTDQAKHILFIPRWYPSKADPMLGLFVRKHAQAAVSAGYKISVAYAEPGLTIKSRELFSTEIRSENNLTEVIVSYRPADGISGITRQIIAWNLAVKTAVQQNGRPQLIHAHVLTRTALLAFWYSMRWSIKFVITEHWSRYYAENFQYKGWLRKVITRFVVRKAAKVTVVSNRLAASMKQQSLGGNFILIPNVVDTGLFNITERVAGKFRIVSISCFEEKSKNLKMLIDAFSLISEKKKDVELVLIGEGADLEMIKRYAFEKQLPSGSIRFTGMLQGQALANELQQASCLAITSNYETFAIVAYEAMACGVPVVATDVADLQTFIKMDSGRVVPVGDSIAFADALQEVIEHQSDFDRVAMRFRVEYQFSFVAVADKLSELYSIIPEKKQ